MIRTIKVAIVVCLFVAGAGGVGATDIWDVVLDCASEDASESTCNQLIHGQPQEHDAQAVSPARDFDFMIVETKARHSYEVKVFNSPLALSRTDLFPGSSGLLLDRVDDNGTVLTPSTGPDGQVVFNDIVGWTAVRWMGGNTNQRDFIRVRGPNFGNPSGSGRYMIELLDTTYFIPRFNNSGSQITVFLIQNTTPAPVTGSIYFYSAAGALLHTEPLNLAVHGLQVFATSAIGALTGAAGSATIAHTGGYGALAGKAVALEPATGFSFDTLMVPLPR